MIAEERCSALTIFGAFALFFILNGLDYINLGDIVREGKFRYLFLALVPVAFFSLRKNLSWPIAYFGALALANWTMNSYFLLGCFPLILIFAVLFFSQYLAQLHENMFANVLMWSGFLQALLSLWQTFGMDWYAVGLYGHETLLGPFLVAALAPALWRGYWKTAAVILAGALCTRSSMSYASLATLLLVFIWHRIDFKMAFAVAFSALGIMAVGYQLSPSSELFQTTGREFIWGFGWKAFLEHPYFGSGIGSWVGVYLPKYAQEILEKFRTHVPFQLHNDYLDFLLEYGFVPALPLLAGLAQFFRYFRPTWTHAVCLAFLVNAGANFLLCISSLALIFVVCWAFSWKSSVPQGGGLYEA